MQGAGPFGGGGGGFNPYMMGPQQHFDPYFNPYGGGSDLDYLHKKKIKYDIMKNKLKASSYKEKANVSSPLTNKYRAIKELLDHHDELVNKRTPLNNRPSDTTSSADKYVNDNFKSNLRTPNKDKGNIIYRNMFTPNKM